MFKNCQFTKYFIKLGAVASEFLPSGRREVNWNYFTFPIWTFTIKRKRKDSVSVSSCNSVNSAIIYNMEIMMKMSFVKTLISRAIMIIVFNYFRISFQVQKSNVAVYQGHINFRKEVPSDCNWTRTHYHVVHKRTLNHLAKLGSLAKWLSAHLWAKCLSGCGFKSSCSHLNFRFGPCFEQGVTWHSGNYRVWIHSEARMWHDKKVQLRSSKMCTICRIKLDVENIMFQLLQLQS